MSNEAPVSGNEPSSPPTSADTDAPDKPKAIVGEMDDNIRSATSEILRREQFEVTPCKDGGDLLRLAKELIPAVLMLDVSMPGVDWRACVRILARCRETRPVKVVLICPPEYDRTRCDSMKADGAFAVLLRPLKRAAISEVAAKAVSESDAERERLAAAMVKRPPVARAVESNNSLLKRQVVCPFHEDAVPFDRYTLRNGKIVTENNFFDLPVYKSPARGADFVNYHPLAVIVCPRCWFASVHAAYFQDPNEPKAHYHPVTPATAEAIRAAAVERRHVAATLPAEFYTERRTLPQAVKAYELAIACSNILLERNRYSLTVELARIGNAQLRLAHLKELANAPVESIDGHYREAMDALAQAFFRIDGPSVYKIAYQMIALGIHFGEDKNAYQYLNLMIRSDRDPALPKDERGALQRYLPRCQRAWEDRGMHRSALLAQAEAA